VGGGFSRDRVQEFLVARWDFYPAEATDFWRVEQVRSPSLLRLRAELKVPGKAWLQFEAVPEEGGTRLVQTAFFAPTGLLGWSYW
jgi:hypothetical protein